MKGYCYTNVAKSHDEEVRNPMNTGHLSTSAIIDDKSLLGTRYWMQCTIPMPQSRLATR
jgi:hypothetical protein